MAYDIIFHDFEFFIKNFEILNLYLLRISRFLNFAFQFMHDDLLSLMQMSDASVWLDSFIFLIMQ